MKINPDAGSFLVKVGEVHELVLSFILLDFFQKSKVGPVTVRMDDLCAVSIRHKEGGIVDGIGCTVEIGLPVGRELIVTQDFIKGTFADLDGWSVENVSAKERSAIFDLTVGKRVFDALVFDLISFARVVQRDYSPHKRVEKLVST
ncbi:hypothetical protein COB55_02800 [Candidatus Wolfebacteria bacterium]|nr:MAG: hypothetical protein COB55_02800 [Candidatus Wolfebacteria bacterium]